MTPEPSQLANILAPPVAGMLAFDLAGGSIVLLAGPVEGWGVLALFAAVPAAAIALLPFSARIFCFLFGLLALAGTWLLDASGSHNPLIVLPWIAICFGGAALVAELCVRGLAWLLPASARGA